MRSLYFIYDFFFILGFIIYSPVYFWRKKINLVSLKEKLGFISRISKDPAIWIQVVSVGEVNLIANLIKRLKEVYNCPIVLTTTTLTGNFTARKHYSHLAEIFFFPFDITFIIKKAIRIIKPKIFVAVETEIWPNIFDCLNRKNIPVIIINGRVSDKAFKRYKLIKPFIRKVLNKCQYIAVQNEMYKKRFLTLGASEDKVIISGNMKFESIYIDQEKLLDIKRKYLPLLKKNNNIILIAASTHAPEEEAILQIYKDILQLAPELILIIAPRHPERVASVEKTIFSLGFKSVKTSKLNFDLPYDNTVFLIDTVGELLYFYSISDICFIGGSIANIGGHNILEPIYFLKSTLFGPHMENFCDIEEVVLKKGAALKFKDIDEFKIILLRLVKDGALRRNLRNRCLEVFEEEKRSLDNNLSVIAKSLEV
ncbi:MAG: hypothetical protein KBB01_05350 [Candidatus Omnitrophica bacterium]|jgi:3-deoxy-D-manno-octulosonic-acid transferase|nr:hypothetical protein [Candidatus Omnitrophota bacterium]